MLTPEQFFAKLAPYALTVADALEAPRETVVPAVIAQWDVESGREADKWIGHNNYAGITNGGPPNFRQYPSLLAFAHDYVNTLGNGYYAEVIAAMQAGAPAEEIVKALGLSPWDAGHYNDGRGPGVVLLDRLPIYQAFVEVPSPWAAEAWAWSKAAGINDGLGAHNFVTEEQVMVFLHRYAGLAHAGLGDHRTFTAGEVRQAVGLPASGALTDEQIAAGTAKFTAITGVSVDLSIGREILASGFDNRTIEIRAGALFIDGQAVPSTTSDSTD